MNEQVLQQLDSDIPAVDYYQLLGRPCFDPRTDEILTEIRQANRELLPYQNHRDHAIARRALRLQYDLARAEDAFNNRDKLKQHHEAILQRLTDQFAALAAEDITANDVSRLHNWLADVQCVHRDRLEAVSQAILERDIETCVVAMDETMVDVTPIDELPPLEEARDIFADDLLADDGNGSPPSQEMPKRLLVAQRLEDEPLAAPTRLIGATAKRSVETAADAPSAQESYESALKETCLKVLRVVAWPVLRIDQALGNIVRTDNAALRNLARVGIGVWIVGLAVLFVVLLNSWQTSTESEPAPLASSQNQNDDSDKLDPTETTKDSPSAHGSPPIDDTQKSDDSDADAPDSAQPKSVAPPTAPPEFAEPTLEWQPVNATLVGALQTERKALLEGLKTFTCDQLVNAANSAMMRPPPGFAPPGFGRPGGGFGGGAPPAIPNNPANNLESLNLPQTSLVTGRIGGIRVWNKKVWLMVLPVSARIDPNSSLRPVLPFATLLFEFGDARIAPLLADYGHGDQIRIVARRVDWAAEDAATIVDMRLPIPPSLQPYTKDMRLFQYAAGRPRPNWTFRADGVEKQDDPSSWVSRKFGRAAVLKNPIELNGSPGWMYRDLPRHAGTRGQLTGTYSSVGGGNGAVKLSLRVPGTMSGTLAVDLSLGGSTQMVEFADYKVGDEVVADVTIAEPPTWPASFVRLPNGLAMNELPIDPFRSWDRIHATCEQVQKRSDDTTLVRVSGPRREVSEAPPNLSEERELLAQFSSYSKYDKTVRLRADSAGFRDFRVEFPQSDAADFSDYRRDDQVRVVVTLSQPLSSANTTTLKVTGKSIVRLANRRSLVTSTGRPIPALNFEKQEELWRQHRFSPPKSIVPLTGGGVFGGRKAGGGYQTITIEKLFFGFTKVDLAAGDSPQVEAFLNGIKVGDEVRFGFFMLPRLNFPKKLVLIWMSRIDDDKKTYFSITHLTKPGDSPPVIAKPSVSPPDPPPDKMSEDDWKAITNRLQGTWVGNQQNFKGAIVDIRATFRSLAVGVTASRGKSFIKKKGRIEPGARANVSRYVPIQTNDASQLTFELIDDDELHVGGKLVDLRLGTVHVDTTLRPLKKK